MPEMTISVAFTLPPRKHIDTQNLTLLGRLYNETLAFERPERAYGSCWRQFPERISSKQVLKAGSSQRSIDPPVRDQGQGVAEKKEVDVSQGIKRLKEHQECLAENTRWTYHNIYCITYYQREEEEHPM